MIDVSTRSRTWFLDIPWDRRPIAKGAGVQFNPHLKAYAVDVRVPVQLRQFMSQPYSVERWREDEYNGWQLPTPMGADFRLRQYQKAAVRKIVECVKRGHRGFLLADETGLGKTLTALYGVYGFALLKGFSPANRCKVLVVASTKGAVSHWRSVISRTRLATHLDIIVVNYDSVVKLLDEPASAKKVKGKKYVKRQTARKGTPKILFDAVIADEPHKLKNPTLRRSAFARIARYDAPRDKAPFIIYSSATVAQTPLEVGYLCHMVGDRLGKKVTLDGWGQFLHNEGFSVTKNSDGVWRWYPAVNPKDTPGVAEERARLREKDLNRMNELLFGEGAPSIRRQATDIKGYPAITRVPYPLGFTLDERDSYTKAWLDFAKEYNLLNPGKEPKAGLALMTRLRQKVSLLKVPSTVDLVKDLLDAGSQVAVSALWRPTADALREQLAARNIPVVEVSGRIPVEERDANRLAFQRGDIKVVIFSVVDTFSFHANEKLPNGEHGSPTPRALIVHDIRLSAFDAVQLEGRCHRDGQHSPVYYPYFEESIEKSLTNMTVNKLANMKTIMGDNEELINEARRMFDHYAKKNPRLTTW